MTEVMTSYKWNDEVRNYCLTKNYEFIIPYEQLKLSEVEKEDLAESLQNVFYMRTGKINERIGYSYENDKALAKRMKVWD